jgi:RNA polymerase sigma factor (sigma-70 family)
MDELHDAHVKRWELCSYLLVQPALEEHGADFERLARKYAGGQSGVAQLALEVFWDKLPDKIKHYDPGKGQLIGWATALLRNCVIDELRRQARLVPLAVCSGAGAPEVQEDLVASTAPGPTEEAAQHEHAEIVREAVRQLYREDEEAAAIVVLRTWHGMTLQRIAAQLGRPHVAIWRTEKKALEKIGRWIQEKMGDQP